MSSSKALRCAAEHAKHLPFCCISSICNKIHWSATVFPSVLDFWGRFSSWKQQLRKVSTLFSDWDGILVLLTLSTWGEKKKIKHPSSLILKITRNTLNVGAVLFVFWSWSFGCNHILLSSLCLPVNRCSSSFCIIILNFLMAAEICWFQQQLISRDLPTLVFLWQYCVPVG